MSAAPLRLPGQAALLPGYACGLRHPALRLVVALDAQPPQAVESLRLALARLLGLAPEAFAEAGTEPLQQMLRALRAIQQAAGLPVQESGRLLPRAGQHGLLLLPTPTDAAEATLAAFAWLVRAGNAALTGQETDGLKAELPGLVERLRAFAPAGSNTPHFIRAAQALGIPWRERAGGVVQYGDGARARWLASSFTDQTPHIAARLARSKSQASLMLRQAGVPVPRQLAVASAEEAVQTAALLGYPVVIKPADLDGGVGVAAGLVNPTEVRAAFEAAARHSRDILLEQHVEGRDYRLNVFQGELVWAIERQPAQITGDGRGTVRELLERLNADPRRGEGKGFVLRRVALDEEAMALLRAAGFGPDDVPPAGRELRLRRIANIGAGGMPLPVFERVHPDNAKLAVRAAEALGLDLAGVDLLIPDIARSWRESGAAVCEVNGQPTLGQITSAHLYPQVLGRMVSGDGRVPCAVLLGAAGERLTERIAEGLRHAGLRVGLADGRGIRLDQEWLGEAAAGSGMLMTDRRVDAALVVLDTAAALEQGLPFARYDLLVLAGRMENGVPLRELFELAYPACDGEVLGLAGSGLGFQPPSSGSPRWLGEAQSEAELAGKAVAALLEAARRHAQRPDSASRASTS